jgi:type VI secretion system protein ImpK
MSPTQSSAGDSQRRPQNLALAFQEILTVSERLRTGRQAVTDPAAFRHFILEGLKSADGEARRQGYAAEDIKLAIFAVVAFLDESVLNLRAPVFADWPRRPLQEELFGHHVAGEVFFQNLQQLLGKSDSHDLADLLEVYHLCLLLGFAGRYSLAGRGELKGFIDGTADKIGRIRGPERPFSPYPLLTSGTLQVAKDPWIKTLMIAAVACLALTVVLFVSYKLMLSSGVSSLADLAASVRQ